MRKARKSKSRKSRKSRRKKLYGAAAKSHARKTSRRKRRRKAPKARSRKKRSRVRRGVRKRPTIIVSRSGRYYRPRRSRFFKRPRRVNGRRRRRNGGGSIVSSIRNVLKVGTIAHYASLGGGIFAGTLFSRMLNTGVVPFTSMALPVSITQTLAKARPLHGLLHILVGSVIATKSRNKYLKDAGYGMAALGGFDIVMQIASRLGVPGLPTFSGMNVDLLGRHAPRRGVSGMNVNLRGMNVSLMGDVRPGPQTETHLADAINDMVS